MLKKNSYSHLNKVKRPTKKYRAFFTVLVRIFFIIIVRVKFERMKINTILLSVMHIHIYGYSAHRHKNRIRLFTFHVAEKGCQK